MTNLGSENAMATVILDTADCPVGTLFKDLKFFITQRVPSRNSFIRKIENNGGDIVRLEAQADHIIADHLKARDNPPGAISWRYIDESIARGALQNAENADYQCGPPQGDVRPAASTAPTRGTRVDFTAEDDAILYDWVDSARRQNIAGLQGNQLYKQLELEASCELLQSLSKLTNNRITATRGSRGEIDG
jgi:hypothetical protein